ncbi:MAG: hypothetical protein ACXADY_11175 [Candidatus Hodarchaeales archaeon]
MVEKKTNSKEKFLHSAETELINYLKQLGSLPSQSPKKEDPLSNILKRYTQKWQGVEK